MATYQQIKKITFTEVKRRRKSVLGISNGGKGMTDSKGNRLLDRQC